MQGKVRDGVQQATEGVQKRGQLGAEQGAGQVGQGVDAGEVEGACTAGG